MVDKKATLKTYGTRIIHGTIHFPESDGYYLVTIDKIDNPIRNDWKKGETVKISKNIVEQFNLIEQ